MSVFHEANTVQDMVTSLLSGVKSASTNGHHAIPTQALAGVFDWKYIPRDLLNRENTDVLLENNLREVLIRLNPAITANPDLADEVIYKLRAVLLSVDTDGPVRSNENFTAWLRGEKTMPFGKNNEHVTIRLIDRDDLDNNEYITTNELVFRQGTQTRRFDNVLFVNGIPLVLGECKTPVRPAITWLDGASQIHDDYEQNVPMFFVPNVFSFATDGRQYRYGTIAMPLELWAPWRTDKDDKELTSLAWVRKSLAAHLSPEVVLDIMQNFTIFATDKKHRRIKIICRYQQYDAANQIVERVVNGKIKKGLVWHFQGSGKSLLMVFASQKLRLHPDLKNPTVLIVVDRVDLDTQITATFNAADIPNMITTNNRKELQELLSQDTRKIIITTIHKFGEANGVLNHRSNIIALVDEAHRTQEGDLGKKMRAAMPQAFLFGLTGTPINKRDRNTFWAFGADEDANGYMSRYSFEESIRDGATLALHFQTPEINLRVDKESIDEAFRNISGHLSEEDQADLSKQAGKMSRLVKSPERINKIVSYVAQHFKEKVEPEDFKAQLVAFDREACVLYKEALDKIMPPEASDIVMSFRQGDPQTWKDKYERSKDEEEKLLDRFRDPADPLKILIVTSRLLTGFDAPILQTMYLDKPMKDHNLLQGICRTNRPYINKTHGLIVDFLGIFDDVTASLDFDEKQISTVISNLEELKKQVPGAVKECLEFFTGVDRSIEGYEGLEAAQEKLPDNEKRDEFAASYSVLTRLWEALSPDSVLDPHEKDYKWLSQIYLSVRPPGGNGKLLWHSLGAKTIDLINQNIHVGAVIEDLPTLILDADVLKDIADGKDPDAVKEIEIKISKRLANHPNNPKFIALGERLQKLRDRHQAGLIASRDFIESLLKIAEETVQAEKEIDPAEECRSALTELFDAVKSEDTPVLIERLVDDIDSIVRIVSFDGWQHTSAGEREVRQALSKTLLKYKLHKDREIFNHAYEYIEQYY